MAFDKSVLKAKTDAELLSFIINNNPILQENIDLPVQGESIQPIGQIIVNNERYRNAFIDTVNLIGLTIIKRNGWDNPWNFTNRGTLNFGQQVRELIIDLCKVYDYNKEATAENESNFLKTEVPNVFNYLHEVNFQKFYKTTTSDAQLAMAFDREGSLFDFIDKSIAMLYESLKYDTYIVDKYMLCRRIVDGTMTSVQIENFATKTTREIVSDMKSVSNKMTFRSPNYNPAGIRIATPFDRQITIVNTDFDAKITTEVLATSYFRNDAEMRTRLALIDGFANHDVARLTELLEDAYIPFTEEELTQLKTVPAVVISDEWFMDYDYALDTNSGTKQTEFYNPQTLKNNHFLHAWRVFSTSPFENGVVFTSEIPSVSSVEITPSESTVSAGLSVQLSVLVETEGFANKAVRWSVDETSVGKGVTINQSGLVKIPKDFTPAEGTITVTATSIYNSTVSGQATITVA